MADLPPLFDLMTLTMRADGKMALKGHKAMRTDLNELMLDDDSVTCLVAFRGSNGEQMKQTVIEMLGWWMTEDVLARLSEDY